VWNHIERGEYSLHHELLVLCKWEILLSMKRITRAVSRGKILILNYSDTVSNVFINGFLFVRKIVTVIRWPCASAPFGGPHGGGGNKTESDLWLCRWFSCCRSWLCICLWHIYTKTCEYSDNFPVGCSEFPSNSSLCLSLNDEWPCDNYP